MHLRSWIVCFLLVTSLLPLRAQPVCEFGAQFPPDTAYVPAIGLFGYTGTSLVLLRKGERTPVVVMNVHATNDATIHSMNGKVYFKVTDGATTFWESDGTTAGTRPLFTVGNASYFNTIYDHLYYATSTYQDTFLWRSDGRSVGVVIASMNSLLGKEKASSGDGFGLNSGVYYRESYYFSGLSGYQSTLLAIPASRQDTVRLIAPLPRMVQTFVPYRNRLFLRTANELWSSDGTTGGTSRFWTLNSTAVHATLLHANKLYFFTLSPWQKALYVSEGTEASTRLVTNLPGLYWTLKAVTAGPYFYFQNIAPSSGAELWRSDGTATGTRLVKDIIPGPGHGYYDEFGLRLIAKDSTIYFTGSVAPSTFDVWRTNGTEQSTVKLTTFGLNNSSTQPNQYFFANDLLYFNGYATLYGFSINEQPRTVRAGYWSEASTWATCRVPESWEVVQIDHRVSTPYGYRAASAKNKISSQGRLSFGLIGQLRTGQ